MPAVPFDAHRGRRSSHLLRLSVSVGSSYGGTSCHAILPAF
jgi:hypothetical protein